MSYHPVVELWITHHGIRIDDVPHCSACATSRYSVSIAPLAEHGRATAAKTGDVCALCRKSVDAK